MLDTKTQIMTIMQEECAEVIQAISKIMRFGWDDYHPETGISNRCSLERELADLIVMITLLKDTGELDLHAMERFKMLKLEKLKLYSTIFDESNNHDQNLSA